MPAPGEQGLARPHGPAAVQILSRPPAGAGRRRREGPHAHGQPSGAQPAAPPPASRPAPRPTPPPFPQEAELAGDAALGSHVRLRLGGYTFPPTIYYKIYTHRSVADIGAFAPRDYLLQAMVDRRGLLPPGRRGERLSGRVPVGGDGGEMPQREEAKRLGRAGTVRAGRGTTRRTRSWLR